MRYSRTRRDFLFDLAKGAAAAIAMGAVPTALAAAPATAAGMTPATMPAGKYNVLFIAFDDLRPELGCYSVPGVIAPNIDKLAGQGLVFDRAYCQQALCCPSRSSLLTGLRPDTTRVWDLETHFRAAVPDVVTLPQCFKQHGYDVRNVGKIFHHGGPLDDPPSWSAPRFDPDHTTKYNNVPALQPRDVADNELPDGKVADRAVTILNEVKDKPFFLAIGFRKPHLPFEAPRKYFEMYNEQDLQTASNPFPPSNVPPLAMRLNSELKRYQLPDAGSLTPEQSREMIHGYRAATTYADAMLGKVLDELERLQLREKTIIILWGDHGYHLGEHDLWCKHSNFEVATRSPLIISLPGQRTAGQHTNALVEFVDIYPSLCEAAGLPAPRSEGVSFIPLVEQPQRPWKSAAFSQYPRGTKMEHMGYTMRTDRYRYTEWQTRDGQLVDAELYDHQADPDENANIVKQPENRALVEQLAGQLKAGWKAAIPK